MNAQRSTGDENGASGKQPRRARLPGFVRDDEIGLGEIVKRATSRVGIKPCGACAERARRLDNWLTFSKKRS